MADTVADVMGDAAKSGLDVQWPVLTAPALIGGCFVGAGCSTRHVVELAQRQHAMMVESDPEAARQRDSAMLARLQQICQSSSAKPVEDAGGEEERLSRMLDDLVGGVSTLIFHWDRREPVQEHIERLRSLLEQCEMQGS